jgi:hypothetical protein
MTPHRALSAMLVASILALYALMAHLDGPSDHHTEMAQAADLQAAIKAEAALDRFERAAAALCGNAELLALDADGAVHCKVRKPRGPGIVLTRMGAVGVQP